MKKGITVFVFLLTLAVGMPAVCAAEMSEEISSGEMAEAVSFEQKAALGASEQTGVTIVFDKNGGQGSMENMTLSDGEVSLTKNTFTRTGFTFAGWNTQADGSGEGYADGADARQLMEGAANGQLITLYAQWKINAPKISKLKLTTPVTIKVSFGKNSKAAGHEIQYAAKSSFKGAKKVTAKKSASSKEITNIIPGKTYYVRMRSYYNNNGRNSYSDWSKAKKIKVKKVSTISNTKSQATIEADVTLQGSGTGYHAKLVICTATSAVSFGIQYDSCAIAPYTGKTMALIENVASNNAGGQTYTRPGNKQLKPGKAYHMMMTIDKKGNGSVYLDYKKIGSFSNAGLANQFLYLRVEGSARLNGDSVKATFKNIKCKTGGVYDPDKIWTTADFDTSPTISSKVKANGTIVISGHVSGLPAGGDWDNQYEKVSGIRQFIQ